MDRARHQGGLRHRRGAVVHGRVGDVEPHELADQALELVDGLQRALAHLRLVRRVGGVELAAPDQVVDNRGNVVIVVPGTGEADEVTAPISQALQRSHRLPFGYRGRQIKRSAKA